MGLSIVQEKIFVYIVTTHVIVAHTKEPLIISNWSLFTTSSGQILDRGRGGEGCASA